MIQLNVLKEFFKLQIGFRPSLDLSENYIDPNSYLLTPLSGLFIEDEHPILTLANLKSVAQSLYQSTTDWNSIDTFAINTIVFYEENYYTAVQESTNAIPGSDILFWTDKYYFSDWLEQKVEAAIISFWTDYNSYQTGRPTKKFFENKVLFDGAGSISDTITNTGKLRGFEFNFKRGVGIAANLFQVGVQLTETATFDLKLYHSSKQEALKTINIAYTTANSVQFFDLNWILDYKTNTFEGGSFYVAYDQTELGTAKAINKVKDWRLRPAICCSTRGELTTYNLYSKFLNITPFESDTNSGNLPDIEDLTYNFTENAGLNFKLSSYCDLTNFYIEQKDVFLSAMRKKIALDLMLELIYNANGLLNRNDGMINKEALMFEVNGNGNANSGKKFEYAKELKQLSVDLSGIDSSCLQCNREGLHFGSIG